jgi:hypothetical protein
MENFINKNAIYKEMIARHGKHHTYLKVSMAIDGDTEVLTKDEARQVLAIIDEAIKEIRKNINQSIIK